MTEPPFVLSPELRRRPQEILSLHVKAESELEVERLKVEGGGAGGNLKQEEVAGYLLKCSLLFPFICDSSVIFCKLQVVEIIMSICI